VKIEGSDAMAQEFRRWTDSAVDVERVVERGEIIGAIAEEARGAIQKRTRKGEDVEGAAFAPYSEAWRAKRKAAGLQTGRVDLSFSGAMLLLLSKRIISPRIAELFVPHAPGPDDRTPRSAVAHGHQHGHQHGIAGRLPRRTWLGIGVALRAKLEKLASNMLGDAIREKLIEGRRAGR